MLERRIQAVWTTCSRCAAHNGVNASEIQALRQVMARKLSYLYLAMGNIHWLLDKDVQFELCCGSFRVACFYLRSCKVLLLYSSYQFTYGGYSSSVMSLWVKLPQWKVLPIVSWLSSTEHFIPSPPIQSSRACLSATPPTIFPRSHPVPISSSCSEPQCAGLERQKPWRVQCLLRLREWQ